MTPKDYRDIAKASYSVDSKYKDGRVTHEGDLLTINGKEWKVLKAKDNKLTGFQAMAIAPVSDGNNPSNVVIAYAGTNVGDFGDLCSDFWNVGLSKGEGQLREANQFADQVSRDYSDASISVTGHSLGGFLALAQGAEHHWQTVTFNAPDPYTNLSWQARKWVKENPNYITNFVNYKDIVTYTGGLLTSSLGRYMTTGRRVWIDNGFATHSISMWKFDDKGNIIDGNGKRYSIPSPTVLDASMTMVQNSFEAEMKKLRSLKKRLSASGGGLSSGEKIYLDSVKALSIVSTASAEFNLAMANVMKIYHDGIREAKELWKRTLKSATTTGNLLEEWEIREALESVGCTEDNIVGIPVQQYQMKIHKIQKMSDQFKHLEEQIVKKISEIVAHDSELAQQLRD
ncbi:hypothetical protein AALM99_07000 [Lactococcus muris]|uniref:Fungal lipase-like domain-containing protein n=1 Tax=Lactococcus muris TaxID=2941330 RepID=A0ABV4D8V5_9LACT